MKQADGRSLTLGGKQHLPDLLAEVRFVQVRRSTRRGRLIIPGAV